MKSEIEIDSEKSNEILKCVKPSLDSEGQVKTKVKNDDNSLEIDCETETLGQLRGVTDSVFRLTSLSKKIIER